MAKPFTPSGTDLDNMIASAMAKCDASVEQARLKREAREEARAARAWGAEVKARFYARIQRGASA